MVSADPYRASVAQMLCFVCSEPTQISCARCGRPLCGRHQPKPEERCSPCEGAFIEQITREEPDERKHLAKVGTLIVTAFVVVIFAAGFAVGELAVWVLATAAVGVTPLLWRRKVLTLDRERRRQFLLERPPEASRPSFRESE